MPSRFLHEHSEFKTLLEICARDEGIHAPSLVEKDYWIMHVLWGLRENGFRFELKGGTSLSKGYGLIHRFSEDLDIQIHPPGSMTVNTARNQNKQSHIESRRRYFDWLAEKISVHGIVRVARDHEFDDPAGKLRNAGIRLHYESHFDPVDGLKDGILLEVGFDKTQPSEALVISSWAYDRGAEVEKGIADNRARGVECYRPEYTFVEKVQTVVNKYRRFKESGTMQPNLLRHYYDIHMLLGSEGVRDFIGTEAYLKHRADRIRGRDKQFGVVPAFDILHPEFEREYERTASLYYRGQPPLVEIVERVQPFLERL